MVKPFKLSNQQLQMVQALSKLGEGGARDVQQALSHLELAYTTVATVLSRLEKKGVLESEVRGRERIYHCAVDESTLQRSMVSSLVSNLFDGDSKALLAHLVEEGEFEMEELDELRELIKRKSAGGKITSTRRGSQ